MSDWYSTGYDSMEQEKEARERRRLVPWRFFLKVGASSRIIFLDDFTKTRAIELPSGEVVQKPTVPFAFDEHNLTIDGDWKNWLTCRGKIDPPCAICNAGYYKYYIGMMSILSEWTDRDGVKHWSKRLLAAKLDAIERIKRRQAKAPEGQLQFSLFEVSRTTDQSVVTGDDFDFEKIMTRDEVEALLPEPAKGQEKLTIDPYDYKELFAPKSKKELEDLLASGRVQPPRQKSSRTTNQPSGAKKQVSANAAVDGEQGEKDGKAAAEKIDF